MEILLVLGVVGALILSQAPARAAGIGPATEETQISTSVQTDVVLAQVASSLIDQTISIATGGVVQVDTAVLLASGAETLAESVLPEIPTSHGLVGFPGLTVSRAFSIKVVALLRLNRIIIMRVNEFQDELIRVIQNAGIDVNHPSVSDFNLIVDHFKSWSSNQ